MTAVIRATCALGAILIAAALGSARADNPGVVTHAVGAGQTGAEIYTHICQGCHMSQGQGAVGAGHYPRLAHDDTLAGRLGQVVSARVVLNGHNGMPAFGTPPNAVPEGNAFVLSDAQIAEVVNYVRTHFGNNYQDKVTPQFVAALPHPPSLPGF